MSFSSVYPHYLNKAIKKGRTEEEVNTIISWLTGYSHSQILEALEDQRDFQSFFDLAPSKNPNRTLIKGVVCKVRVEEIEEDLMREIRYLDKLIDELAKGKSLEKIFNR